jgi:hypothetical protein
VQDAEGREEGLAPQVTLRHARREGIDMGGMKKGGKKGGKKKMYGAKKK